MNAANHWPVNHEFLIQHLLLYNGHLFPMQCISWLNIALFLDGFNHWIWDCFYYDLCIVMYTLVLFLYAMMWLMVFGVLFLREQREHVKDLSCLSRSFSRIVLVDNNPFSFLLQPLNGIPCIPFYAGQPNDNQVLAICRSIFSNTQVNIFSILFDICFFRVQLMEAILPLLKHLSLEQDVRPILHERFRMPEWFEKQGLPMSDWIHDSSCSNWKCESIEIRGFNGFCNLSLLVNCF